MRQFADFAAQFADFVVTLQLKIRLGLIVMLSFLAGMGGFEPPRTDPESAVLPLDDIPAGTLVVVWLGREDSNPRMAGPKPAALPLGDSPVEEKSSAGVGFGSRSPPWG